MVEEISLGVSNRVFIAGIITAILASSTLSIVVSTQWARGPQGPKGDTGSQGPQGEPGLGFDPIGYISISATAFVPERNSVNYGIYGWLYNHGTGSYYARFYAPVQLPHGVKVSNFTFYWYDGGDDYLSCVLYRQHTTGIDLMAEADSPEVGAPGDGFSHDLTIIDNAVDNSQYAYYLCLVLPETSDYYFKHAIIEYEYPA